MQRSNGRAPHKTQTLPIVEEWAIHRGSTPRAAAPFERVVEMGYVLCIIVSSAVSFYIGFFVSAALKMSKECGKVRKDGREE